MEAVSVDMMRGINGAATVERPAPGQEELSLMPDVAYKRCSKCESTKPTIEFSRQARASDGLSAHCKACVRATSRAWYRANRERHRASARLWEIENADKVAEARQRSKERNPEADSENSRRQRLRHPEKAKARRAVSHAVQRGKICKPEICERCEKRVESPVNMHAHHHDYSKPLEVEWLCRNCHVDRHT